MIKEKPILFSAPMVRAVLDGSKTQTRRIVKPKPYIEDNKWWLNLPKSWLPTKRLGFPVNMEGGESIWKQRCPFGKVGDRLWVRETFSNFGGEIIYRADGECFDERPLWKPSIFMPRWASRIDLEITDIRVERLNDTSEEDAIAEGIEYGEGGDDGNSDYSFTCGGGFTNYLTNESWDLSPKESFKSLWQSINGADSWDANPWVWVVEFERVKS